MAPENHKVFRQSPAEKCMKNAAVHTAHFEIHLKGLRWSVAPKDYERNKDWQDVFCWHQLAIELTADPVCMDRKACMQYNYISGQKYSCILYKNSPYISKGCRQYVLNNIFFNSILKCFL